MAIQDDIMAMLSQVSDAGDQATGRGRLGSEMYGNIAGLLSVDDRKKAMREIDMLGDSMQFGSLEEQMQVDPLTGDRVATIIEKYMADAGDGVPIPSDMLVDDTRAAEGMMEVMPSPNTAPRIPVNAEQLAPLPSPALDASAMDSMEREIRGQDEGLAGLMAGQMAPLRASDIEPTAEYRPGQAKLMGAMRDMSQSPSARRPEGMTEAQNQAFTRMMKSQIANEIFPRTGTSPEDTYDLFMSGDGEAELQMMDRVGGPSGREYMEGSRGRMTEGDRESQALAIGSTFIPFVAIPKLAAQVGISAGVVNKFLSAGPAGVKRLESMIRSKLKPIPNKTPGARMTERVPLTPTRNPLQEKLYQQMQNPGGPTGGLARGGAVRDNIMNTYGRM